MAKVKIIWSDRALKDIEEIINYITEDSEYFAINFASKIINTVEILKDFSKTHTITSIAEQLNMSRVGIWKILKQLQLEDLVKLIPIGSGKTI